MGELPQGFTGQPESGSRLVLLANQEASFTANQETDVRTALTRGLAEYMSRLRYDDVGGRSVSFARTFHTWADPEDEGFYPSAVVAAVGAGSYDASKFTGDVVSSQRVSPDGAVDSVFVVSPSEFSIDLEVDVRSTDLEERKALCAMLERDLNPVDWRYGFVLVLPHYFNQRATYEITSSSYVDSEDAAQQRLRRALFVVRASVPLTLLRKYPNARVRAAVQTT